MRKIQWEVLDGWSVKEPEEDVGWNSLKIYMPYGLPECVLMPGDDVVIPTGLWFPGLHQRFLIIPAHQSYPNKDSDVFGVWEGKLRSDLPVLSFSILNDTRQVYVHIINLGKTELRYKPGTAISYFHFVKVMNIGDDGFEEGEEELAGYQD